MTAQEFFQEHWRVMVDNNPMRPTLRGVDKNFFRIIELAEELGVHPFVNLKDRYGNFFINPIIKEELDKEQTPEGSDTTKLNRNP